MSEQPFKALGLHDDLVKVTEQLYFTKPTAIQEQAIPAILEGKHILGRSKTGSGKTHAFLLPLLNNLEEDQEEVQLVITAPTRELSQQLYEEIKTIRKLAKKEEVWRARLIIGGLDRERMMKQLASRPPHIVVGTPGRILDMINAGVLSIYTAKAFVIDEADLMLDLKFIETIDQLFVRCQEEVQTLVFSATVPKELEHFIKKYIQGIERIDIEEEGPVPEQLEHRFVALKPGRELEDEVVQIADLLQPYVAIVFANSKEEVDRIAQLLVGKGHAVARLHGDLSSRERRRVVKGIHQLQFEYVVATDLASRGIDIKGASHVINANLPKEKEFYLHRVGRTARAGASGLAISLYTSEDKQLLRQLKKEGIPLSFYEIKDGAWVKAKGIDEKSPRSSQAQKLDRLAWQRVAKPKKVKPGYKKKMLREKERIKQELKRQQRRKTRRRK